MISAGPQRANIPSKCGVSTYGRRNSATVHGVQRRMISVLFRIFEIIIFCFVVAICDLVHDVETVFHLSYMFKASGNLF